MGALVGEHYRRLAENLEEVQMKTVLLAGLLVLALLIGGGSYFYYRECHGFNSCNNPVCQQDCYENGVRVR